MRRWYPDVFTAGTAGDADLLKAMDAADAYIDEYEIARGDLIVRGSIETMASKLPGLTDHRFAQLQDLEAILEHLENREKRAMVEKTRFYLEHYQRTLSDRIAREYAEASDEVQLVRSVLQRIGYVRNLYLGIMKGFEYMHFQLTNVTKLRCAGLDDAEIGGYRD
jgi:gamma-glutamylcysteine synthetase